MSNFKSYFITLLILILVAIRILFVIPYQTISTSIKANQLSSNITMIQFNSRQFSSGNLVAISANCNLIRCRNRIGTILKLNLRNTSKHSVLVQFDNNRITFEIPETMLTKLPRCYFHIIESISDRTTPSFQTLQSFTSTVKHTIIVPVTETIQHVFKRSRPIFGYHDSNVETLCAISKFLHELTSIEYIRSMNNVTKQTSDGFLVMDLNKIKGPILQYLFMTNVKKGLFDILCYWNSEFIYNLFADILFQTKLNNTRMHQQLYDLYGIHIRIRAEDPDSLSPLFVALTADTLDAFDAIFHKSTASEFYIDIWIRIAASLVKDALGNVKDNMLINLGKFNQSFIESFVDYYQKANTLLNSRRYTSLIPIVSKIKEITDTGRLIVLLDSLIIDSTTKVNEDIHAFIESSVSYQNIKNTLLSLGLKTEQQLRNLQH